MCAFVTLNKKITYLLTYLNLRIREDLLAGHPNSEDHNDMAISRQTLHVNLEGNSCKSLR